MFEFCRQPSTYGVLARIRRTGLGGLWRASKIFCGEFAPRGHSSDIAKFDRQSNYAMFEFCRQPSTYGVLARILHTGLGGLWRASKIFSHPGPSLKLQGCHVSKPKYNIFSFTFSHFLTSIHFSPCFFVFFYPLTLIH